MLSVRSMGRLGASQAVFSAPADPEGGEAEQR